MLKLTRKWLTYCSAGILICILNSCGVTYNDRIIGLEQNLVNQNFSVALQVIEDNKFLSKNRNELLYLMEKGKVEHMLGNFEKSNVLFEKAYTLIENQIQSNVGQAIASNLTNPMAKPYKGEDFEKVTIHYYMALNYFQLGMPNEALVEAKRINIKLNQLNQRYKKNKNKYTEDAFAQILQGLLYEATGDINNAFIAYRNAANLYLENDGVYYEVPLPYQLQKDLLRTAKVLGFTEEYNFYQNKFKIPESEIVYQPAEAIIFWENGLGPAKDQTQLTLVENAFVSINDEYGSFFLPIPPGLNVGITSLAIPKYIERESYYVAGSVSTNNQETPFETVEDYYPIARQCLQDRMLREVIDMAVRLTTKKATSAGLSSLAKQLLGEDAKDIVKVSADAAGAITEKADTRNWQSLPATISYARVSLESDKENNFTLNRYRNSKVDKDTIHIDYKRGLQLVSFFDVGKTAPKVIEPTLKKNKKTEEFLMKSN